MKPNLTALNEFQRAGYAIVPDVLERDECAHVLRDLEHANLNWSRAGVRHAMRYKALRRLAEHPQVLDIAKAILGNEAVPFRATLFDKSPTANWLVAWHQDTALPMRAKHETDGWGPWSVKQNVIYAHAPATALSQIVALRIHLDDSTAENGPLRVLPGTHCRGVLGDHEIRALAAKVMPIDCPVATGGVLAMRPLTVHASSKSRSAQSRRVLHVEYAPSRDFVDAMGLAIA